jgi:hypothetical protein
MEEMSSMSGSSRVNSGAGAGLWISVDGRPVTMMVLSLVRRGAVDACRSL